MSDGGDVPRDKGGHGTWPGLDEDPDRVVENVCSQALPEEKCSTAEFRNLLKQPEPTEREIARQLKRTYKKGKKGYGYARKKSKKRANPASIEKRRKQVVEYCRTMWRERNDLEEWRRNQDLSLFSRSRCYSASESSSVVHRAEALFDNIEKRGHFEDNAVQYRNQWDDEDHDLDLSWSNDEMPMAQNEEDHQLTEHDFDAEELEERLSQMSTDDEMMPLEEIRDESTLVPSSVENFFFTEGSMFYKLPRMSKTFPTSTRALNVRISALDQFTQVLAQGGVPLEKEAGERALQNELKLINGLRSHCLKKLKESGVEAADDPSTPVHLDVATAAFASGGLASGRKLRTVNGILRLAGRKVFPSDRIVLNRLQGRIDWVKWTTKETYINGELIPVSKVENLREVLEKYVNTTWRTVDVECPEARRKLMLRIGVDRGGGTTKIAVSLGNRKRSNNSPSNWMVVGVYAGKDDAVTLRGTVQDIFKEFDDLSIDDLQLRPELREHFDDIGRLLIGDFPSICAVLGVKGHSARNPCFICTSEKGHLHIEGETREYATCEEKVQNGVHSHSLEPLLKRTYPVVPLLHSFMGPSTTLFQRMEEDVKKVIVAKTLGLPQSQWFQDTVKVRTRVVVEDEMKVLRECVKSMKKLGRVERAAFEGADCAPWCSQRKKRNATCWVKCACGKWLHTLCVGILPSRSALQSLLENGDEGRTAMEEDLLESCPACASLNDCVPKILEAIDKSFTTLQSEHRSIEIVRNSADNGLFLTWEATCRRHNIFQGRFHGGSLTGNQACDFLRASSEFLDAFAQADGVEVRVEMYRNILTPLNALHEFTRSRYLTEPQILEVAVQQDRLKTAVLGAQWLSYTPKFHLLCTHLSQLARNYGTIGLHSEQGVEHLHKLFATEELCFLQKRQPARFQAAATRLNAKAVELHANPYTILHYKLNEREKEISLGSSDPYDI